MPSYETAFLVATSSAPPGGPPGPCSCLASGKRLHEQPGRKRTNVRTRLGEAAKVPRGTEHRPGRSWAVSLERGLQGHEGPLKASQGRKQQHHSAGGSWPAFASAAEGTLQSDCS